MKISDKKGTISSIVLLDGVQTTATLVLIPFLLFNSLPQRTAMLWGATPIAVGFLMGIFGTYMSGKFVDLKNPIHFLQKIQFLQILIILFFIVVCFFELWPGMGILAAISIAISRTAGPAKDKIRSYFIPDEDRTKFNALVRRYFLVLNETSSAAMLIFISLFPRENWPFLLLIPILIIGISLILVNSLKAFYVNVHLSASSSMINGVRILSPNLLSPLILVTLMGISSAIPSVGLSAWISKSHQYEPWVISVIGISGLAFDFIFIKYLGSQLTENKHMWNYVHRIAGIFILISSIGVLVLIDLENYFIKFILLIIAMSTASLSYSISTIYAMEIQFSFGGNETRGRVASYTRISSVVAMSLASWLAPGLFFDQTLNSIIFISIGFLVLLMPRSIALSWRTK